MPAKSKEPHLFKVGDIARVVDTRDGSLVDKGQIEIVYPCWVTFRSELKGMKIFKYRRKGIDWVEAGRDQFLLEAL